MKLKILGLFMFLVFLVSCGGGSKVKGNKSLEEQRLDTIKRLTRNVNSGLDKLDKDIKEAYVWNLKQVKAGVKGNKDVADEAELKLQLVKKLRPIKNQKEIIVGLRYDANKVKDDAIENAAYDVNPEFNTFKNKMKEALAKIKQTSSNLKSDMKKFQKDFRKLK